jgi:hypothetical protein
MSDMEFVQAPIDGLCLKNIAIDCNEAKKTNPAQAERKQLGYRFTVAKDFYEQVLQQLRTRLIGFPRGCVLTAEQLLGKEYWALLLHGEEQLVGRCIAHAVGAGIVPLRHVKGRHEYPSLYQVI